MADTKITALTALTAADPANDVIPIVDVSDTSMAASGTTKKISVNNILGASGTATLASAAITGAATVGTTLGVTGVSTLASAVVTGDLTVRTNKLAVTSTGVGIGTASPDYAADVSVATTDGLRVKNTLATSAYFNRFHISNDTGINFIGYGASYAGGTILGLGAGSNSIFSDSAAPFGITTTVNQPLVFGINGSTAMTLNSTGLGIGGSPSGKLDVFAASGGVVFHGSNSSDAGRGIYMSVANTSVGVGTGMLSTDGGSYSLVLGVNGSEKVRLTSAGNFGIGVTDFGTSAANVLGLANATAPTTSPAGMGQLYVEAGSLKYRGTSGLVTILALA